jgi:hypothetical protein
VPGQRTTVTELVTGLGMLGYPTVDAALAARPPAMVSLSPEQWAGLEALYAAGGYQADFAAAWANGAAFLRARDGLRGRVPVVIEWKGSHRAPGDEVAPIDLRVDHVYLVSCKYESDILHNASPGRLFDRLLAGGPVERGGNWFAEVAPEQYQALYQSVRPPGLPLRVEDLRADERDRLGRELRDWPHAQAASAYGELVAAAASASAARWRAALGRSGVQRELVLWRLLRIGSAPYFMLGARKAAGLRLRVATPWDWRQRFELRSLDVAAQPGGQPRVGWAAVVRDRQSRREREVRGHVEVRSSHGRFAAPEAKVYLDTPHADVPGYFPLV